ncbi:MAG: bifunctional precorrin-2 dehydrogenase/sirohydrochlorin ferrochelatase, partial [Gammaproteobacteria bacterium]|nr:bifunctional precorrin-2 dehydrogenase/sirohydrochlorin ferrochelatase [Gammaproteobacteria bacterium]
DAELNRRVHEDTRGTGALVNVVDDPQHCDFIFPAVLRRDCLTAAISTDGKAPFVSGHLRLVLENIFP